MARSLESRLPPGIREDLNKRLLESHFKNCTEHAEWLNERGVSASTSAVQRYAALFREHVEKHRPELLFPIRPGEPGNASKEEK